MIYTNARTPLEPVIRNGRRQIMLGTPLEGKKKFCSIIPEDNIAGLIPGMNLQYSVNLMTRGSHKVCWECGLESQIYMLLFAYGTEEYQGEIQLLENDVNKVKIIEASTRRNQQVRLLKVSKESGVYIRIKHVDDTELFFVEDGNVYKMPILKMDRLLENLPWHSV